MIPTINNGTAVNYDFNPFVKETYTSGIQKPQVSDNPEQPQPEDMTRDEPVMALTASDNPNDPSARNVNQVARNHGTLIPPASTAGVGF